MSKEVIEALRKQADEIAREGHFGWGNTMTAAADAMGSLLAENERLESAWQVDVMKRKDALIEMQENENDRVKGELSALLAERDACKGLSLEVRDLLASYRRELKRRTFADNDEGDYELRWTANQMRRIDAALQGEQP
jgi:hypothetical protein